MTTTQSSDLTGWLHPPAFKQVFDGNIPDTTGDVWIRIVLDTPFLYINNTNLVIAVNEVSADFDGDHDKFYFTNTPTNGGFRSRVIQDDVDVFDHAFVATGTGQYAYPNIKIEGLTHNCRPPLTPSVSGVNRDTTTISWLVPQRGPLPMRYVWRVVPNGLSVDSVAADSGTVVGLSAKVKGLKNGTRYDFYATKYIIP